MNIEYDSAEHLDDTLPENQNISEKVVQKTAF
jgi:hypothetical protein